MSASIAEQNAQEQPVPPPSQPRPHNHITTNIDTLFEDEGTRATPAQQPVLINKAPSQIFRSETGNPDRGSPSQIAQAKAASRELLKIDAENTRQRRPDHTLAPPRAEAYNSSADGEHNVADYDSDARAKEETTDEDSFRAQAENDAAGPGDFPNDEVVQAAGRLQGSSKGSREAFGAAETTKAG
ncbi:hypothetical protein MTO96_026118 [Rhipicephalus appendiculatus]